MQKRCVMKKRKIDHYSFLPVVGTEEAVRVKCVKGLVAWSTRRVSMESFSDDFPDGFHLHDWTGSGSPEARAGRLEQNLAPAPCGQCPRDECPGSLGGCLLDMNQGAFQDAVDEAEMSPFVLAAICAGFNHDTALRMEVEIEIEMKRIAGEMDSIH